MAAAPPGGVQRDRPLAGPPVTVELARAVAARIGTLDGVVAVTLGGSLARGRADPHSDIDLGLYYDPARPFSVEELRALATELDDRHAPEVVGLGDWGPWINGGAWTLVQGVKVDLLYRDLRLVDRVLDDCAAGRTTCAYQPGHPHGFHSHSYAGEVHHGLALHDPTGALAGRRRRTSPYPPALRREVVRRYLWGGRLRRPDGQGGGRARRPGLCQRLPVPGRRLPGAGAVRPQRALVPEREGRGRRGRRVPPHPAGLRRRRRRRPWRLGPDPARLAAALEATAALTATVRGRCRDQPA